MSKIIFIQWIIKVFINYVIFFTFYFINLPTIILFRKPLFRIKRNVINHEFKKDIKIDEPVVFVHGLLGKGNKDNYDIVPYWNGIYDVFPNCIAPTNLPMNTMRDRAIDLFYYIKGGQMYFADGRKGNYYEGKYKLWNKKNRLTFIGHSSGSGVIKWLMYLLETNQIPNYSNENDDDKTDMTWIKGFISLSGLNNGIVYGYDEGIRTMNEQKDPIKWTSFTFYFILFMCMYDKYVPKWIQNMLYTFGAENVVDIKKLSFFELFDSNKNLALLPNNTILRDLSLTQSEHDNRFILKSIDEKLNNVCTINVQNEYDYKYKETFFLPIFDCNPICLMFTLIGCGRLTEKDIEELERIGLNTNDKMFEEKRELYLISDCAVPIACQTIPHNNKNIKYLYDYFDTKTETFNLNCNYAYSVKNEADHLILCGVFDSMHDLTNVYRFYASLVKSIDNAIKK